MNVHTQATPLWPSNQLTTVITLFASQLLFCQQYKHQSPVQMLQMPVVGALTVQAFLPNVAMTVQKGLYLCLEEKEVYHVNPVMLTQQMVFVLLSMD